MLVFVEESNPGDASRWQAAAFGLPLALLEFKYKQFDRQSGVETGSRDVRGVARGVIGEASGRRLMTAGFRIAVETTPVQQRCAAELCISSQPGRFRQQFQGKRSTWLGREGSNLRMAESKSAALPLGYAPSGDQGNGGRTGIRRFPLVAAGL